MKNKVTPKDFFLWAGAMIALYGSVFAFIALFFDYINYAFPDALQYYASDPYQGGVSYEMATLIVLFPLYLLLMWTIRRDIAHDKTRADIWVRRWALVLTLFVAGATVAGDLITLIMYFFNGDLTMHFVLKVLLVLGVAAVGVMHFLADMWGYWAQYPERQRSVVYATSALVVLSIIAGFFVVGTPWQVRLYRFDDQKINDLNNIQYQVVYYYQQKGELPNTLSDLNDPISGYVTPVDPQKGSTYVYKKTATLAFQLCATFNAVTQANSGSMPQSMSAPIPAGGKPGTDLSGYTWEHGAGETCFDRTIDPTRYPVMKSATTKGVQ